MVMQGRDLLTETDDRRAQLAFLRWDSTVGDWLDESVPIAGLTAEWSASGFPRLDLESKRWPRADLWDEYRRLVIARLQWLSLLPARIGAQESRLARELSESNRIFVVHGHDQGLRDSVSRLLQQLRLEPVVLHEQINAGRTIIEKFTDHTDVGFAVVLLTPDDRGGPANDDPQSYRGRARQNVVFELGFFLGKLGRNRVCALYREGVEIPSDYAGVVFVPVAASDEWRLRLAREIDAAGIEVDLNLLK